MNLDFSDDEKALKDELRRWLDEVSPLTRNRAALNGDAGVTRALTRELGAMGWLSAALPEQYGGQGLGYVALCGIAEELGRSLAPTSCGSSIFLAAEALLTGGSGAQRDAWLPGLGSGEKTGAFAIAEGEGPLLEKKVQATVKDGRLSGVKVAVPDGMDADVALVAARGGAGVQLFVVDLNGPGVERKAQAGMDPSRPIATLTFKDAAADPLGNGAGWDFIQRLLDRAAVLFAFEQVGAADRALEMAREYALSRYAFGQPIGGFQGIKHKLADVWIANELARSNAYYAAYALSGDREDLPLAAATARVAACEALERAARENIQTHGGIAATWASDCHLFYRRGRHLGTVIGSVNQWRDRVAGLLIAEHAA